MSIASSFARIVCINLDRRPDRWARVRARFARHGIGPVERFAAVDGSSVALPEVWRGREGVYGCLRSHLDVVASARGRGDGDLLIFEDDVEFAADLGPRFERAMAQRPDDWDILYFGGIHAERPRPVGDSLATGLADALDLRLRDPGPGLRRVLGDRPDARRPGRRPAHAAPGSARLLLHLPPRRLGRGRPLGHPGTRGQSLVYPRVASCWATIASTT